MDLSSHPYPGSGCSLQSFGPCRLCRLPFQLALHLQHVCVLHVEPIAYSAPMIVQRTYQCTQASCLPCVTFSAISCAHCCLVSPETCACVREPSGIKLSPQAMREKVVHIRWQPELTLGTLLFCCAISGEADQGDGQGLNLTPHPVITCSYEDMCSKVQIRRSTNLHQQILFEH